MNITPIIKQEKRHPYYKDSVNHATDMLMHFDGIKPGDLLKKRRPGESKEIHEYRLEIYECPTKQDCTKIQNSLMKIRKSPDWVIRYDYTNGKIASEESFENYMENSFPKKKSFTNWFFSTGFKVYLTDPGSVCLYSPLNKTFKDEAGNVIEKPDNAYYKPYPTIFKSHQVLYYEQGEIYILKSKDKSRFVVDQKWYEGDIYIVVTKDVIETHSQIDNNGNYKIDEFKHSLEATPIVHFPGVIEDETSSQIYCTSRLSPILPSFREAVREYSDHQAVIVQHNHPTMWALQGRTCKKCKGAGTVAKKDSPPITCPECNGAQTYPFNPYEHYEVRNPEPGQLPIPTPPAGYITKDTAITKLQDERIRAHRKNGLGALNMEWLLEPTGLNQSGYAKDVDKSELNNFVHAVAEDIINFFDQSYFICAKWRYQVFGDGEIEKIVPEIPVPEKYDILSETYLISEIKILKDSSIDPAVIRASLLEYVNKKYSADPSAKQYVSLTICLDPFSCQSEDSIIMKKENDGIAETDYVIHCNIGSFVKRALQENPKFYSLKEDEQKKKMEKYANDLIKSNSVKEKVLDNGGGL